MEIDIRKELAEIKKIQEKLGYLKKKFDVLAIAPSYIQIDPKSMKKFAPIEDWKIIGKNTILEDILEWCIIIGGVEIIALKGKDEKI